MMEEEKSGGEPITKQDRGRSRDTWKGFPAALGTQASNGPDDVMDKSSYSSQSPRKEQGGSAAWVHTEG